MLARELSDGGQPLGVAVLLDQVFAVGLEHDGELQVDDLVQRRRDALGGGGAGDIRREPRRASCTRMRSIAVNMYCWGSAMRTWMRPMRARSS